MSSDQQIQLYRSREDQGGILPSGRLMIDSGVSCLLCELCSAGEDALVVMLCA